MSNIFTNFKPTGGNGIIKTSKFSVLPISQPAPAPAPTPAPPAPTPAPTPAPIFPSPFNPNYAPQPINNNNNNNNNNIQLFNLNVVPTNTDKINTKDVGPNDSSFYFVTQVTDLSFQDVDIAGYLKVNGQSTLNDLDVSGNLLVYGSSSLDNLDLSGNLNVNGNLDVSGFTSLNNLDVSGNLNVNGSTFLDALDISSGEITLDDATGPHLLHSINGDLYYDFQLIAKAGDISNVSDWSLYPALSTVDINNEIINEVKQINFGNNINVLDLDSSNNLQFNGQPLSALVDISGNVALWANYPAKNNVDMSFNNITKVNTIYFKSNSTNTLNIDASNNLLYNGQKVYLGTVPDVSANVALWSNYPAISTVDMNQNGINFDPTLTGYSNSQFDTNMYIGKSSYLIGPDVIAYPYNFQIGSLVTGAHSISMYSVGSISLNSVSGVNITGAGGASVTGVAGVSITGGGGVSITGGGGITALGATITLGAGSISALGGIINLGAGSIQIGSGLLNIVSGNIAVGSGAIEIGTGALLIGTAGTPGGGIQAYGGKIISSPSGTGPGGVSITGTASLETNAIIPGNLGYLQITGLDTSTNPITINNVNQLNSAPLSTGMSINNVNTINGYTGGFDINNVTNINGQPYPPTNLIPSVVLAYAYTPGITPLNIATPTDIIPSTIVQILGNVARFAYLITGNIRINDTTATFFQHPSVFSFYIGFFDSLGNFPIFQQYITIAREVCPHLEVNNITNSFEIPFSGFLTNDMVAGTFNPLETYNLRIWYEYFPAGPDGPLTFSLDILNCCIQRMY